MIEQDTRPITIVELQAENFKRIRAVRISPRGPLVQIGGRNGQGKSSVLDAIAAALGGGKSEPDMPIRKGAKKATIVVDLGTMTVEWSRTADSKQLVVRPKDGAPMKKPQEVLDRLIGQLTFDPLAFARMKPREQLGYIQEITGLKADFDRLGEERAKHFDARTAVGREVRTLEARLSGMPIENAPDSEESVVDLMRERDSRAAQVRANAEARNEVDVAQRRVVECDNEIADLEGRIALAQKRLATLRDSRNALSAEHDRLSAELATVVDPNVAEMDEQIRTVEQRNAAARRKKDRAAVAHQLAVARKAHDEHARAIERCDEARLARVAETKLPIEGLGIDEEGVTYNGVPFPNCSASERLRVSVAIGLAMNPNIRVMLVHDGSLLDSEAMADLARIAEEHGAQLWVERVSDSGGVGVVIEDGEVVTEGGAA